MGIKVRSSILSVILMQDVYTNSVDKSTEITSNWVNRSIQRKTNSGSILDINASYKEVMMNLYLVQTSHLLIFIQWSILISQLIISKK